MRPLIIDLGREYRGGQHQALLLLKGVRARGHAPELIAARGSVLAHRAKDAGISVCAVAPWCRRLAAVLQIRRMVRTRRADLVHANEPHALTAAWLARAHRSVPVVVSRRIALPLSSGFFPRARYHAASKIIAISRFVQRSVVQSGLPADCVMVVYDGVEIPPEISDAARDNSRGQFKLSPDALCIGNVAAFVPEKGHAILLRAFAKLRSQFPKCVLLFSGDGAGRQEVQELARQLQLLDIVKFSGPITEISKVLAAMDVFAFPSHEEALGSALLAAMAHGLPVIAMAFGGIPEIVENGKNGLSVENLDPNDLAATIALLLANPEELRQLGKSARETIQARFSADHMVDATLRLYEDLIAGKTCNAI